MGLIYCRACGKQMSESAVSCPACGHPNESLARGEGRVTMKKSRVAAGLLALFLGGLGVHKFYLEQSGKGLMYLFFCWTLVPAILAFIDGVIFLTQTDEEFAKKNLS